MICPKCKTEVSAQDVLCPSCGLRLKFKCPRCGNYTRIGSSSCSVCGFAFVKFCPKCGSANYASSPECRKCSYVFDKTAVSGADGQKLPHTDKKEPAAPDTSKSFKSGQKKRRGKAKNTGTVPRGEKSTVCSRAAKTCSFCGFY